MSWTSYIDNLKAQGVGECGIFSLEGAPWAVSPGMKATPEEVKSIAGQIQSQNFSGIQLMGFKYTMINSDSGSVTGKCRNNPKDDEKYLAYCALGKTFIMIGATCGPSERGTSAAVEKLKDYLVGVGY